MKYICKQKLPFCDVGEEVSIRERHLSDNVGYKGYEITVNGQYHDWPSGYAPIKDWFEPKRWRAAKNDFFYILDGDGYIMQHYAGRLDEAFEEHLYEFGNYFQTKEQAEKARLLVLEALKKAHDPS